MFINAGSGQSVYTVNRWKLIYVFVFQLSYVFSISHFKSNFENGEKHSDNRTSKKRKTTSCSEAATTADTDVGQLLLPQPESKVHFQL